MHSGRIIFSQIMDFIPRHEITYAFDSTTIILCLSLFPWARFRKRKGAAKLYTLMDLHGSIPSFISITHGKIHYIAIFTQLILEPAAFYIILLNSLKSIP